VKGWTFAFEKRWLGYLALVVVFAVGCTLLSMWQLARRDEARAEISRVENNWESAPVAIDEVLGGLDEFDPDDTWTSVRVTGRYLTDSELLARGRPNGGRPGFEQLVPFQVDGGAVFVIDRGWLPVGNEQDAPDAVPPPPSGTVTVVARVKAGEPTVPGRSAPAGQIATIHLPDIADRVGQPTYTGAYGLLTSEEPAVDRPMAVSKPVADEGPHLSYAFQWLVFGVMAFIGLGWAIRQEYRFRNADDPEERERALKRREKAAAKPASDAEIEDALLDRR